MGPELAQLKPYSVLTFFHFHNSVGDHICICIYVSSESAQQLGKLFSLDWWEKSEAEKPCLPFTMKNL